MNAEVFVDTNVLLYAIDDDLATIQKREIARQLFLTRAVGMVDPGGGRVLRERHFTEAAISTQQSRRHGASSRLGWRIPIARDR